jgi:hypothetical protein
MKTKLLFILILCSSCSTLKKSMTSGVLIGGLVGGTGGSVFSPDRESKDNNSFLGRII